MISEYVGLFGLYYFFIWVEFVLYDIFSAVILFVMLVFRVILPLIQWFYYCSGLTGRFLLRYAPVMWRRNNDFECGE